MQNLDQRLDEIENRIDRILEEQRMEILLHFMNRFHSIFTLPELEQLRISLDQAIHEKQRDLTKKN